jgi:hypothetical protein
LTNLDALQTDEEYVAFILPIPIEKGDACPVRVTAVSKKGLAVLKNPYSPQFMPQSMRFTIQMRSEANCFEWSWFCFV